jgi:hypothetical protein
MSKEKALAELNTAMNMNSPENIHKFVWYAIRQLRTEPEPEDALKLAALMIRDNMETLEKNLLDYADSPEERAMKLAVCESCLYTIKEYASTGLKGRAQGSLNVAEAIQKAQVNSTLNEYAEVQEMKMLLKENDAQMMIETTTTERIPRKLMGGEN